MIIRDVNETELSLNIWQPSELCVLRRGRKWAPSCQCIRSKSSSECSSAAFLNSSLTATQFSDASSRFRCSPKSYLVPLQRGNPHQQIQRCGLPALIDVDKFKGLIYLTVHCLGQENVYPCKAYERICGPAKLMTRRVQAFLHLLAIIHDVCAYSPKATGATYHSRGFEPRMGSN